MAFDVAQTIPNFPAQALDARVELQLNNAWIDISSYVYMDTTSIGWGHPDESTTATASTFGGMLNNSDGRFSQLNPLGPYYGYLGLNTPIRVSLPNGSSYLRSETDTASGASSAATSSLNPAAGFEVWVDADLDNWATPTVLAAKWNAAASQRSWAFNLPGDGTIQLIISADGTINNGEAVFLFGAKLPIMHGRMAVRVKYDLANNACSFWYQVGGYNGSWVSLTGLAPGYTQGGTVIQAQPTLQAAFASTAAIEVGKCSSFDYGEVGFSGKMYAMALLSGVSGGIASALCSPDWTGATAGASSVTDAQSFAWLNAGTAEISNRDYRFYGQVAAWPQAWTPGGANATVTFTSSGLLRRMGVTSTTVQSPMRRAYSRLTGAGTYPWGYWPCEDGGNATQVAAITPNTAAAVWSLATPQMASSSSFLASAPIPVLNGAALTCIVPKYASQAGVAYVAGSVGASVVRWLMDVPSGGDTGNSVIVSVYYDSASAVARMDLIYGTGGSLTLAAYNTAGTQLWTTGAVGFSVNGVPARFSIETQNLTTSTYNAAIVMQAANGFTDFFFAPGTSSSTGVSGTIGNVARVVFNPPGTGALVGTAIGHISVQSAWTSLFNMLSALEAYAGEAAGVRFQRLCGEEGIQFRGIGNMSDTTPMGVQSMETIVQLLQECADADMGMWFELRAALGFGYRSRVSIGNQATYLALNYSLDHLTDDLSPTHDDQVVKNDVTVTNQQSGSTADAVLNDGSALAVNAIGRYDLSTTLNLALDTQNIHAASWMLHSKTVNEPRYTAINVDLGNTAVNAMWYQIAGVMPGDRVVVSNPPVWLPPDQIDQIIQGGTERFSIKDLYESWNGIPTTPWNVASYADPVFGRGDTDGSTLAQAAPANDATLLVAPTGPSALPWTLVNADFPFDVKIAGERITVNSAYGPGLFDGSFEQGLGATHFSVTSAATVASSTAHSQEGSAALLVTSTATGAFTAVLHPAYRISVTPGATVAYTAWVYMTASGLAPNLFVNWYDSGGNFLSTSAGVTCNGTAASTWYPLWITQTAPANAAYAGIGISATSGSAGNAVYLDAVYPVWALMAPLMSLGVLDGSFETGVAGWTVSGGTVAQSAAQHHTGSNSALLTVSGSPAQITLRPSNPANLVPVIPRLQYTALMWVYSSISTSISAVIDWRTAAGSLTGSPSSGSTAVTANTWTPLMVTGTAPAAAALCGYGPTMGGSPANGTLLYLDDVLLVGPAQQLNVTRSVNGVSKAQAPGADVRLFFTPVYSF